MLVNHFLQKNVFGPDLTEDLCRHRGLQRVLPNSARFHLRELLKGLVPVYVRTFTSINLVSRRLALLARKSALFLTSADAGY